MVSINVLCLVIVGGMGSIPGVILGAFALKGIPEMLRDLEIYRLLVFGTLLVIMMIVRPEGLWPAARPKLEIQQPPDIGESETLLFKGVNNESNLETRQVTKLGGLTAVNKVDLFVPHNCIASIIGPNGAGKTTLFNCISGFYTPELWKGNF